MIDVIMPKMGESITEGTILEWKKQVGDNIIKDECETEYEGVYEMYVCGGWVGRAS